MNPQQLPTAEAASMAVQIDLVTNRMKTPRTPEDVAALLRLRGRRTLLERTLQQIEDRDGSLY